MIDLVRRGLRREQLSSDGRLPAAADQGTRCGHGLGKPLKILTRPERDRIPIFVAALTPKSVTQTAEIADGWLPHLFHPERAARSGARRSRRRPRGDPRPGSAADQRRRDARHRRGPRHAAAPRPRPPALRALRRRHGRRGKNFYNDVANAFGYEERQTDPGPLPRRQEPRGRARRAAGWLEAANLVGPASYVAERVAAFGEAGVTHLSVEPVGDDPAAWSPRSRRWVS